MSRQIIPPLSVVRLVRADSHTPQWKVQIGRTFRVGYYSRQDGIGCVWLVNEAGEYEQTVDQERLGEFFEVVERSKERALFGGNRPPIRPIVRGPGKTRSASRPMINGKAKTIGVFHRAISPVALRVR